MRTLLQISLAAFFTAVSLAAAGAAEPAKPDPVLDADPFTAQEMLAHPPAPQGAALRHYLEGLVAASRLDTAAALRALRAATSDPHVSPQILYRALSLAGGTALRAGHYRLAGELMDRAISEGDGVMPAAVREGDDNTRGVAMALRDEPPQTVEHQASAVLPLQISPLGLTTAPVGVEGHSLQAVVDTGANLSTLSTTAAKQLGVRLLMRKASVGSPTSHAVDSTIAVADTVTIGPVILHHVVFLVLDDAALSPGGPQSRIDAIIGFPVLAALGRIALHDDHPGQNPPARMLTITPSAPQAQAGNLRFEGYSLYIRAAAGGQMLPFFVDSGADSTGFSKRYAREFPDRINSLARKSYKIGAAGAVEERQAAVYPTLDFAIAGQTVTLQNVLADLSGSGNDADYGVIGADTLWAKGGYAIDFGRCELTLGGR